MELDKIERLLQKYDDGETSISEEIILKNYFESQEVPEHLQSYRSVFAYTKSQSKINYDKTVPVRSSKKNFYLAGVAASIILALGVFMYEDYNNSTMIQDEGLGTIEDPEQAYREAKNTLLLISNVMNDSRENLEYLNEFNKTKNQFLKE